MADGLGLLEAIALKEQELRARLLVSRTTAENIREEAARQAAAVRASASADAAAEAQAWSEGEVEAARRDADATLRLARNAARQLSTDPERLEAAKRFIRDAVLGVPRLE